jgi:hypothetical protein
MTSVLDCVCVIHGDRYDWRYVENLYAMLKKHVPVNFRLHVFTEPNRPVPDHMIRHDLEEWPEVSNTSRAWWYKIQMFDPSHDLNQVLYFDLDVVICAALEWVQDLDTQYFWAIHDWRRLWRPQWQGINSSMMFWNHKRFTQPWRKFLRLGLRQARLTYRGDQDLITAAIPRKQLRYFDSDLVRSWRWEIKDGGMDVRTRRYLCPGAHSIIPSGTAVMVFHGRPKPHEIQDTILQNFWNCDD